MYVTKPLSGWRFLLLVTALCMISCLARPSPVAAGARLSSEVISGGGRDTQSSSFKFSHTIAQGPIGPVAGAGAGEIKQGFWNTVVESVGPCEQWSVTLTISGSTVTQYRVFGEHCLGTEDYDSGLDVIIPPPGFTFYSYLQGIAPYSYLSTSIKSSEPDSVAWYLVTVNAEDFTVSWYPDSLPGGYCLYIDSVDMQSIDHIDRFGGQSLLIYAKRCECDPPLPPTDCAGTRDLCDRVHLTWLDNSADELGFEIRRDGGVIDSVDAGVMQYDDYTAAAGITYDYCVGAYSACDMSGFCCTPGTRLDMPSAPAVVDASDSASCPVVVSWSNVMAEDGYRIFRNGNPLDSVAADVIVYYDEDASPGSTYDYCVVAYNSCGVSDAACDSGGCRIEDYYAIPECLTVVPGQTGFRLPIIGRNTEDLRGYSICIEFDPDVFSANPMVCDTVGTSAAGAQIVQCSSTESGATVGVVRDFVCPPAIPAGDHPPDPPFMYFVLDVKATAPIGSTYVFIRDETGPAGCKNRMTECLTGATIVPEARHGIVKVFPEQFIRADDDGNGEINISDPILSLCVQFGDCDSLLCLDASDVDDNGEINISDPIMSLCMQFGDCDTTPPPPFPDCGPDSTEDDLDCACHDSCMNCGSLIAESDAEVQMWVGAGRNTGSGRLVYPLYINTPEPLWGFECTVAYSVTELAFAGIQRSLASSDHEFFSASEHRDGRGIIRVGDVAALGLTDALEPGVHQIGQLNFRTLADGEPPHVAMISGLFVAVGQAVGQVTVGTSAGVGDSDSEVARFAGLSSSPNPCNGTTTIRYVVPAVGAVTLDIYNTAGQKVRTVADGPDVQGIRHAVWDGCNDEGREVPPGVYFCRLETSEHHEMYKIVVLR